MPAFYPPRPNVGHLPLTPPGSGSGYGYSAMHYSQDSYAQQFPPLGSRQDSVYENSQGYPTSAAASNLPSYQCAHPTYSSANSLPPISAYYDSALAPILPPLRINDRGAYSDGSQRRLQQDHQARDRQQRPLVKEEKATGGVSATLDYDMEQMTDFVAEATQSMYAFHLSPICVADIDMSRSFQHTIQSAPSFRKWVLQVLSATRLPSATILLSLHYLSDRITNQPESITPGDNQIYRLLAVSLILGSKFLDDNTFINRSWSDVTAIKVTELNQLELKWLQLIRYHLHVDPLQANGLQAWIDAWKDYELKHSAKQHLGRLSPLDTGFSRQHDPSEQRFTPYPSGYGSSALQPYVTPLSARSANFTPASYGSANAWTPSDRGAYDESYHRQTRYPAFADYDALARRGSEERARQMTYQYPPISHNAMYQSTPTYSPWEQSWTATHRYDCACSACACQHQYRSCHQSLGYMPTTAVA